MMIPDLPGHTWRIPNRNTNPIKVGDIIQRLSYGNCSSVIQNITQKTTVASTPSCQIGEVLFKIHSWKFEHLRIFCES